MQFCADDIILKSAPFGAALDTDFLEKACSYCMTCKSQLKKCSGCSTVSYCSDKCQVRTLNFFSDFGPNLTTAENSESLFQTKAG